MTYRRYARIWNLLFPCLDDFDNGHPGVWIPAHTEASAVGKVLCGDGSPLTATLRRGNMLADEYAKAAAMETRAPKRFRDEVWRRFADVSQCAMWLGQVTALANHCPVDDGSGGGHVFIRDSTARRRSPKAKPRPRVVGSLVDRSAKIAAVFERIRSRIRG